jgi:hypothetical protein
VCKAQDASILVVLEEETTTLVDAAVFVVMDLLLGVEDIVIL